MTREYYPTGKCQTCGVASQHLSKDHGYCPECEIEFAYFQEAILLLLQEDREEGEL